jgi:uncharacterized protein
VRLVNQTKNQIVVQDLKVATGFFERGQGLLGKARLEREEALWITPCRSIHTFFMKFAIDAAFVDKNLKVRAIYRRVSPWRLAIPFSFTVRSVIEMSSGRLEETGTEIGDQLYVVTENT